MAVAIVGGASPAELPERWRDRAVEIARCYRAALLAHRGGALVWAGTYAAEPATVALAEALDDLFPGFFGPCSPFSDPAPARCRCWCLRYPGFSEVGVSGCGRRATSLMLGVSGCR